MAWGRTSPLQSQRPVSEWRESNDDFYDLVLPLLTVQQATFFSKLSTHAQKRTASHLLDFACRQGSAAFAVRKCRGCAAEGCGSIRGKV